MRYRELFERDNDKIIANLKALIDHPATEPSIRAIAIKKLAAIENEGKEPAAKHPSGFTPMRFGSDGKMVKTDTPMKPGEFIPRPFHKAP